MELIDREEVIKIIENNHYLLATRNNSVDYGMFTLGIKQALYTASTIDAVPVVHGHWIEPEEDDIVTACICSACGWTGYIMENDVMGMPFCPNCGAKMTEFEPKEKETTE